MTSRRRIVAVICVLSGLTSLGAAPKEIVDPSPDTGNFLDSTHDFISNSFYWPVAMVDQWFKSEGDDFETNPSFFRFIGNSTWVDNQGFEFKPRIRMKIRLKALQRRLSIVAFGESENEASPDISATDRRETTRLSRDNTRVGRDTTEDRIGLRYAIFEWFNSRFDTDVVVSKRLFPEPSLRGRQILRKTSRTLSRFTVTGFYKEDLKFGYNNRLDYEHRIAKRWSTDAHATSYRSEKRPELEWNSGASLNYALSVRETMGLHGQAIGITKPHAIATNYRLSVTYRRNFYRSWLFYELEPGVDWPYVDNHRAPVWSSAFRMEVVFRSR